MNEISVEFVESSQSANATIVRIVGELSSSSITKFDGIFDQILKERPTFVVAEMSRVTMFSSPALGNFMGYRKSLVEKSGELVFCGLSLDLKTKLNLLGAGRIFKMYNDVQSAINAFRWEREHMSQSLTLSFPSELRFVPPVRQLVSRIAKQKNYGSRDSFRIETIVDEVCNNAVEHGGSGRNVDLALSIDRDKVEIQVVNATNPDKVDVLRELSKTLSKSQRPAAVEQKRGRGLSLIKMLSSDLRIDFSDGGTSVHVTRLRGE